MVCIEFNSMPLTSMHRGLNSIPDARGSAPQARDAGPRQRGPAPRLDLPRLGRLRLAALRALEAPDSVGADTRRVPLEDDPRGNRPFLILFARLDPPSRYGILTGRRERSRRRALPPHPPRTRCTGTPRTGLPRHVRIGRALQLARPAAGRAAGRERRCWCIPRTRSTRREHICARSASRAPRPPPGDTRKGTRPEARAEHLRP